MEQGDDPYLERVIRLERGLHRLTPQDVPVETPQLHLDGVSAVGIALAGEDGEILHQRVTG